MFQHKNGEHAKLTLAIESGILNLDYGGFMSLGISKFWVSLLLLLFVYGASCSALHYGQASYQGHKQHLAAMGATPDQGQHGHQGHHSGHHPASPSQPDPANTDLECCALIALSAKNLQQLQTAPEDLVPWVTAVLVLVLSGILFPQLRLHTPLPFAVLVPLPPQTLVQHKTCILC